MENTTESTVVERIREIMDDERMRVASFARALNVPRTTLTSMFEKNTNPSFEQLNKIISAFPAYSIEWLVTGKGEKRREGYDIQILHHSKCTEKRMVHQEVALYDIDAAANLKTLFDNKCQNILGQIKIPNLPRCDGAVYVKGDSMYPLLKSGDIVIYKEVIDFQNVIFGEMYLVAMDFDGDEYLAVKYVNRSDLEGCIKLVSYNSHHEPKDISVTAIRAMALVKASIRMNTMA